MERSAAEARGDGPQQPATPVERLNPAVQDQLNLQSVKDRVLSLHKIISRLIEDLNLSAGANAVPTWPDLMGQVAMANLELFRVIEDIKNVSPAFVVYPKTVTSETAAILPAVLSSKLLPEMEKEENSKREEIVQGMEHLPVSAQIEKIQTRVDMIGEACDGAEKIIAEGRKALFRTREHVPIYPTTDRVKAALIRDQEETIRNAANHGEGLRVSRDHMEVKSPLPPHMEDALRVPERQSQAISQSYGAGTEDYLLSSPIKDSPGNSLKQQRPAENYATAPGSTAQAIHNSRSRADSVEWPAWSSSTIISASNFMK